MRIIGGKYGRRLINPPKNLPVRPTTDLAKEGLFNILHNRIDFTGKKALDLFSGTGSISYEFASRGCTPVVSVDQNYRCTQFIKDTARSFEMDIQVIRSDVFRFIKSSPFTFDLIFCDPPYDLPEISKISEMIFRFDLLHTNGLLIIEHPGTLDLSGQLGFTEHRKYGHVNFSFFQKTA
ncbi:MAG: 16S rRNA (guanine(966)-N(2))-methyltransferase RsmD [Bacteroidetes bacterium]|nr:MAG: 16S rRNA (guanine(966)-N(2))-methyltransferase RsmD [Bacteroidota bacterium]RLD89550.1 MAG: 16S rRNA (guanine(966)-N(2))-methyltransferase RsmD [Bacteroidota bacterium]